METLLIILLCVGMGWLNAYYAEQRGRNNIVWFIIGFYTGLLGLLVLFLLPAVTKDGKEPSEKQNSESIPEGETLTVEPLSIKRTPEELDCEWFYVDNEKKQQGPISLEKMKELWQEKMIIDQTYVWCEKMQNWQYIKELSRLQEQLEG